MKRADTASTGLPEGEERRIRYNIRFMVDVHYQMQAEAGKPVSDYVMGLVRGWQGDLAGAGLPVEPLTPSCSVREAWNRILGKGNSPSSDSEDVDQDGVAEDEELEYFRKQVTSEIWDDV